MSAPAECSRCGTRLAKDNPAALCTHCARVEISAPLAPIVPAEFWDEPSVQAALEARNMGKLIRAFRLHPHHGRTPISQERAAKWVGITQAQLSRIENGSPIVHLDRLIQWALTLRVPVSMLWFSLPPSPVAANSPSNDDTLSILGVAPKETDTSATVAMIDALDQMVEADVHRRQALAAIPFMLTALHEPTRNWLLDALTHTGTSDGGAMTGGTSLRQIRNVLNTCAEADAQQGGGHGRQALAEYLRTTVLPMLRQESDENVRRALFDLAGEQAQLLGWMSYDTAHYGLAEHYLLRALQFSEEARNPVLGAHALATLSHLATTLGHASEGVQLARTGQAALRGSSDAMFADLAVLESRSHALLGDSQKAATAVHRAESALRDVVTENEPPEMRFIDHAYISGEIANTLILLGDTTRAIDFANQSIESSRAQGRARRGALSNVALARAHLANRDIDSACAAGAVALNLSRDVSSARTAQALRGLRRRLAKHSTARPVVALMEEMTEAAI